ncbi:MAG: Na+/H+ antiporter NhaA [Steroidobacteraceae bacterium]
MRRASHPGGVATALAISLRGEWQGELLLERLEHAIKPWVNFIVLPVFAFCNAGLEFDGLDAASLVQPATLGIALGLVLGKSLGIFLTCALLLRLRWAPMPEGSTAVQLFGVACLCGIGFTMSLFIGALAFGDLNTWASQVKLGVMGGSLISALAGAAILRLSGSTPR